MYTDFNKQDDNQQFVSILINGNGDPQTVYKQIAERLPVSLRGTEKNEIVLSIPKRGYNFSLGELRRVVNGICNAKVSVFALWFEDGHAVRVS